MRYRRCVCGLLISLLAVLLTQGCASLQHDTQAHPIAITKRDAASLHPWSRYILRHRHLGAEESRRINERLGFQATRPDELIGYYVVTRHPKRMTGTSGIVFLEPVRTDHGAVSLLISIRAGAPQQLAVKDGAEAAALPHEFLDQFIGRDSEHSYQVGRDPEDFSKVPLPLMPLKNQEDLSQRIADAIRKVIVLADELAL